MVLKRQKRVYTEEIEALEFGSNITYQSQSVKKYDGESVNRPQMEVKQL
jgi:hypothetical protein